MSNKEELFDLLIDGVAKHILSSSEFTKIVADKLSVDWETMGKLVDKIEPDQLAKSLAYYIIRRHDMPGQTKAQIVYTNIIKQAQTIAAEEFLKEMSKEAEIA